MKDLEIGTTPGDNGTIVDCKEPLTRSEFAFKAVATKMADLEKRLVMAETEIKVLRQVTGIGCIIREHP